MGPVSSASAADGSLPLARLFAIAYRQLITELHAELARRGWPDVRPAYGFALLALRDGPLSSSELGSELGMTKQASSKLVDALASERYVRRRASSEDARVRPVELTSRGHRLLAESESIYRELEGHWAETLGTERLAALRDALVEAVRTAAGELPPVRPLW